jgi:hypothetical protein
MSKGHVGQFRKWLKRLGVLVAVAAGIYGGYRLVRLYRTLPPARIDLEVSTTGVSFEAHPASIGRLLSTLDTPKLYLSKFRRIGLGSGRIETSASARWPVGETWIEAPEPGATATIGPASLAEIDLPPHTNKVRVLLAWEEAEPRSLRIAIDSVAFPEPQSRSKTRFDLHLLP